MSRPEFVTNEDILRWSENIDNDQNIPAIVKDSAIIREVCYAGLWLAEELEKLDCTEDIITRIQFTAGRLSFGREPWSVHQKLLEGYKNLELKFEKDKLEIN